jgi:3-hexulose-6-phosphate synthase/6-phospho-3-hexuloisomerase
MDTVLQLALDFINIEQALRAARAGREGGVDWLEAGTPLIKSEGLDAIRALRREFPDATLVADMKVMDAGRIETECAAKAGADVVHVLAAASDATIAECVEAGRRYGARICVDLLGMPDVDAMVERAGQVAPLGIAHLCVHTPIDMQMRGEAPFEALRAVAAAVDVPVAVAGGINSETAPDALEAGGAIVIVGGAITKAADSAAAAADIKKALETGRAVATEMFKRGSADQLREVLARVSAADVTGALHNTGAVQGMAARVPGARMAGRVLTVWTYPGDWAKPVQAIDQAREGDVIVVDAGGRAPAVWGEMATKSCLQRGLGGIVIDGALRDLANIREMGFPAFSSLVTPVAGEPRGQGMIGVPLRIGGQLVRTGDWIVGDDDGVVVIPQERAVEVANRAQAVVEYEEHTMAEIDEGRTLGQVGELDRWEQMGRNRDEQNG